MNYDKILNLLIKLALIVVLLKLIFYSYIIYYG